MKSVGLITFHTPVNYGAALQAVALSKTIEFLGAECNLIDYRNPFFEKMYNPFKKPDSLSVKSLLWWMMSVPYKLKQKKSFERFIAEQTHLTKKITSKNKLIAFSDKFDLYITGSDQVFNLRCSGGERAYFLDFVKDKPKYSYAASLGDSDVSGENVDIYRQLLSDFSKISMRENSGVKIIENIVNKKCICSVDPTLLLNRNEWINLVSQTPCLLKEKYVLVYFMAASNEAQQVMIEVAQNIAKKENYSVLIIGGSMHRKKDGIYYVNPISPDQFVSLFRDASFVVTNSFHGTAFSVNLEKSFFAYVNQELKVEGRVENLLNFVGLGERKFYCVEDIIGKDSPVCFEHSRDKLENERNICKEYLRGIIYGE